MTVTQIDRDAAIYKEIDRIGTNRRALAIWLFVVLVVLFALVLVGGATRLTDSGLSITQWKPIHGIIPPLSDAEWQEEFRLYQQIPEYKLVNAGMSIEAFKQIFWWEWGHRVLARSIGVIFAVPLAFFWITGRIERRLRWPLAGILALGGLQGFIGWWMVSSGLTERTDVSQYRLATHLTMACLIFASVTWIWRAITPHSGVAQVNTASKRWAVAVALLVLFQIYLGALVAGLDAGMAYNTWPLMDGRMVPEGLGVIDPLWRNLFENAKTVQFVHRMNAYLLFAVALIHMMLILRALPSTTHARRAVVLFALICVQALIGIGTLVHQVPLDLALAHQGMALIVLGFAIAHWRGFHGDYPPETLVVERH